MLSCQLDISAINDFGRVAEAIFTMGWNPSKIEIYFLEGIQFYCNCWSGVWFGWLALSKVPFKLWVQKGFNEAGEVHPFSMAGCLLDSSRKCSYITKKN